MINKKIFLSLLTITLIGVATAGTWAYVSDEAPVTGISSNVGKIDLTADATSWTFTGEPIMPGDERTASFTLTNDGNREGYLWIVPTIAAGSTDVLFQYSVDSGEYKTLTNADQINLGQLAAEGSHKITVKAYILESSTNNLGGSYTVSFACKLNQNPNFDNTVAAATI